MESMKIVFFFFRTIVLVVVWVVTFPFSIVYHAVVRMRNWMFDKGWLTSEPTPVPSVGIGNLSVGGAGKSPMAAYVIELLQKKESVALVSRGYGRATRGNIMVQGATDSATVGDEPAMLARRYPRLTVMVSERRREGVAELMRQKMPPQKIVFDDVFQHRQVRPTVNVLVTAYDDLFSENHMLPFGTLREPRKGYRRADIIVVSKCPHNISEEERRLIAARLKPLPHQKVFFSYIEYLPPLSLFNGRELIQYGAVLLVTGIANPRPLRDTLEERGHLVDSMPFRDHHDFTESDCLDIMERFKRLPMGNNVIITTEKDAMRMLQPMVKELLKGLPIYYVPIRTRLLDKKGFDSTLLSLLDSKFRSQDR